MTEGRQIFIFVTKIELYRNLQWILNISQLQSNSLLSQIFFHCLFWIFPIFIQRSYKSMFPHLNI
jgi:hypothetical protein